MCVLVGMVCGCVVVCCFRPGLFLFFFLFLKEESPCFSFFLSRGILLLL